LTALTAGKMPSLCAISCYEVLEVNKENQYIQC